MHPGTRNSILQKSQDKIINSKETFIDIAPLQFLYVYVWWGGIMVTRQLVLCDNNEEEQSVWHKWIKQMLDIYYTELDNDLSYMAKWGGRLRRYVQDLPFT
jgi:hypothetical protein